MGTSNTARVVRSSQSGQAMVEFVVIALVLVGIFLSIWYIGKFHDIKATAIQTARYAAWERTARGPGYTDAQLERQVRARLFSWNQNAYKANDGIGNGQGWNQQTSMWMDHADDKRLIQAPSDVTVRTASGPLPGGVAGTTTTLLTNLDSAVSTVTGGEPLPRGGAFTSTVNVRLANLTHMPAPLDTMNLTLTERSQVVADNWDASSPLQAARRTKSFTPGSAFSFLNNGPFSFIRHALALIEPAFNNFHPGQVCPDVVPMDRITPLNGAANRPVYQGAQPCY